jgi:Na+/H+ antiporter NhaD/arsenite permease-like protein
VSIGGTLTHFAAPPVLMVARLWNWDTPFMLAHFGWRAVAAIVASVVVYGLIFRRELTELGTRGAVPDVEVPEDDDSPGQDVQPVLLPVPAWITVVHALFMFWTVFTSTIRPVLGGFLIFLGFVRATAPSRAGSSSRRRCWSASSLPGS